MAVAELAPQRLSFFAARSLFSRNRDRIKVLRLGEDSLAVGQEAMLKRCLERKDLCKKLQKVDPRNPIWGYGEEFAEVFPSGPSAVWEYLGSKGVFPKPNDGSLVCPEELEHVYPREYIDLDRETMLSLIARFENISGSPSEEDLSRIESEYSDLLELGEKARRASLGQYDLLKSGGLWGYGGPIPFLPLSKLRLPILARDFIQSANDSAAGGPVCVIGLSADEVRTHQALWQSRKDGRQFPPLLGLNKGFSPAIEKMIEEGNIEPLSLSGGDQVAARDLDRGKIYASKFNVLDGLPLKPGDFSINMLYVWHHIPEAHQADLLKNIVDVAARVNGSSSRVAVNIVEARGSERLLRMVNETNSLLGNETAAFDATLGTTVCGGQQTLSFVEFAKGVVPEVNWKAGLYPKDIPQAIFFQERVLPSQQVGLRGY